jgi:DNA-binding MarR family transcriptional regulator
MDSIVEAGSLALGSRMKRLSDHLFSEVDQVYAALEMPVKARWFPIFQLLERDLERSVTKIAAETQLSHPAIVQICRRMRQAGLLISRRDPADHRRRLWRLEAAGRQRIEELRQIWEVIDATVSDLLPAAGPSLLQGFAQLEQALRSMPLHQRILKRWKLDRQRLEILDFRPFLAEDFKRLNIEWLEEYFQVEPIDELILSDPVTHILKPGGVILFARVGGCVVGTCALKHQGQGIYELTKMGVTAQQQGGGIGRQLLEAAIRYFCWLDGRELYLETNSILTPAIALYRRCGFVQQPRRRAGSPYERSNVYMIWSDPSTKGNS